ncbi:hypothetical protein Skr01_54750 [Sphaerisporangium krabiense]|uniref:Uncharacterized protein n=1 Tax=Sphaerisporangium krabiense TaxID=763782 RepID=A0A7W8Z4C4_9ACTN|nr:hypothetical protein [Sphaerisporangium krabiense]MBB5627228.1 hypothetical protein [Sphaerisporangium krabiense]GII65390.1 hypothetical protein Skr01_54750 [Sphaerisporangium krabiense]
MPAPDVAALLTELERSDPELADDARVAVEWLTGGDPLETLTQLSVCEFLWYTLPLEVTGDRGAIARALGRLLDLGGMDRYAALCVSPTTAQILRAYAREGDDAGTAAYQRALNATGVLPPDIAELRWSSLMGPEELGAHLACSAALELAIVCGRLDPSSGTGKADAEALTRRWLTEPRAELGGDNWLNRVHGERLNRWVLGRGAARRELAQPFEVRLHAPIPAPDGPHLQALRWLLEAARRPGGVPLTPGDGVARPLATEAAERFGWEPAGAEDGLSALGTLLRIAEHEMRAVRRDGGSLVITSAGRWLLTDPAAMWQAATAALLTPVSGQRDMEVSVREVGLMLLSEGTALPCGELAERVAEVVVGEGWRTATPDEVARPLVELRRRLEAFHLCVTAPARRSAAHVAASPEPAECAGQPPAALTPAGRAAALTALRAQALRPRQYVSLSRGTPA